MHLGGIDGGIFEEERELRKRYDASERDGAEIDVASHAAPSSAALKPFRRSSRTPAARSLRSPRTPRPKASLSGSRTATTTTSSRAPGEMRELLEEYPPNVAGFWLDVGHAEVLDRLGLEGHERWLDELGTRCLGAHVHDVDGLADHRAPGHGTADWPHYAAKLPAAAPRIFEINQKVPEEQVAAAIPFLREQGVLPAA